MSHVHAILFARAHVLPTFRGPPVTNPADAVRPRVGLLCSDTVALLIAGQLTSLGYEVIMLPTAEGVSVGIVDIGASGADGMIAALSAAGSRVVAFGPGPDDLQRMRARALGANLVVSTDDLLADVGSHIPMIV